MMKLCKSLVRRILFRILPELDRIHDIIQKNEDHLGCTLVGDNVKYYSPYQIWDSNIGDFTYIAENSHIDLTEIGKFCSIGPNFFCGWGLHPVEGISTAPMFYSTKKQNGMTLSNVDKYEEKKKIIIGNDVCIGANVTVLDGISIGDGAVIGAGAVVSKDIPPYAVAAGCPIKIIRYRFDEETRRKIQEISWWNFDEEKLKDVEKMIFDVDSFVKKYSE